MIRLLKHLFSLVASTVVVMFTVSLVFFIMIMGLGVLAAALVDTEEPLSLLSEREVVFGSESSKNEILAIDVTGLIMGEREPTDDWLSGLDFGTTYGYEVKEMLVEAAGKNSIKGVILMVNSPGGTIFGSQAILDGVNYYKSQTGKPVLAFVGGMAASGGYWSILSADEIIADSGTTIGSIGILFGPFKYYDTVVSEDGGAFIGGVMTEQGISTTYITAGKSKDLGNPYRQLTAEETAVLQDMVNESYVSFVNLVSEYRDIPQDQIVNSLGALVFGESAARERGLIDALGSREQAFLRTASLAGVEDSFKIVRVKSSLSFWESAFASLLLSSPGAKSVPSNSSACVLSSMVLAYHGDVQHLCP